MKTDERREFMIVSQQICPKCHKPIYQVQKKDRRHAMVHNTDGNNKNYPFLTRSVIASVIMHHHCHLNAPGTGHIPEGLADYYENFLKAWFDLLNYSRDIGEQVPLFLAEKELEFIFDEVKKGKKI